MKVYTKNGDKGMTDTLYGKRVEKDSCFIKVQGNIDSLQGAIDRILAYGVGNDTKEKLEKVQMLLWQMAGEIAHKKINGLIKSPITVDDTKNLENWIDEIMPEVHGFVRFRNFISVDINEARVRTREVERNLTSYLRKEEIREPVYKFINRLSDYFFALALHFRGE